MKKFLLRTLLAVVGLLIALVTLANFLAEPLPVVQVDPTHRVALPDGRELDVAAVVERSEQSAERLELTGDERLPRGFVEVVETGQVVFRPDHWDPDTTDLYELAEYNVHVGRWDDAVALFHLVPEDHPRYADAQRHIGWRIYSREQGRPERGLAYVNRSLAADPFEPEAWQDAYRVYLGTLGLPMELPRGW